MADLEQAIAQGLNGLNINASDSVSRLAAFLALLSRWNQVYNLTAVKQIEQMVARHIMDSLAILPWLNGSRVLDIGSGAGLPGIPLALLKPAMRFYLLDSNAKRTRFMIQAITELKLDNVEVIRSRVEHYQSAQSFDCVLSRAFATLADMLTMAGHLCHQNGCLLAMKGQYPMQELQSLPPGYQLVDIYAYSVPGLSGERHLVHFKPKPIAQSVSV